MMMMMMMMMKIKKERKEREIYMYTTIFTARLMKNGKLLRPITRCYFFTDFSDNLVDVNKGIFIKNA